MVLNSSTGTGQSYHNYLFKDLYIHVGWPASVHDAHVLANSVTYLRPNNKEMLQGDSMIVSDKDVPIFWLGILLTHYYRGWLNHLRCLHY